jgi:hypothetical protein
MATSTEQKKMILNLAHSWDDMAEQTARFERHKASVGDLINRSGAALIKPHL